MNGYRLPEGLIFGAAASAAQTEGSAVPHSWRKWSGTDRIRDGSDICRGTGFWENWKTDIDIMAAMGIESFRFSVEWARIQPEMRRIDMEAVNRYREMIRYMKTRGIRPLLTLHHFTNPVWFEAAGAFTRPANVKHFLRYVGIAVNYFGDLVSDFCTFNEPNLYAAAAYAGGGFPPGENNPVTVRRVLSVMAGCHICAYKKIHRMRERMGYSDTRVGVGLHMRIYAAVTPVSIIQSKKAAILEYLFQTASAKAFLTGDFAGPLENLGRFRRGIYCDYAGLVYMTRVHVNSKGRLTVRREDPKGDNGTEIYPQGLEKAMKELFMICGKPVWILGCGVCDNEDRFRSLWLYDQLEVIARTKVPVKRFYYWSFTDSFEWLEGERSRFGLVAVDYETGRRSVRGSGSFYRELIRCRGVTADMAERCVRGEKYHT